MSGLSRFAIFRFVLLVLMLSLTVSMSLGQMPGQHDAETTAEPLPPDVTLTPTPTLTPTLTPTPTAELPTICHAQQVISFTPGTSLSDPLDPAHQNPQNALGEPISDPISFVSLGFGGEIVLSFAPYYALNQIGADFMVHEADYDDSLWLDYPAQADVYGSPDGFTWYWLGATPETVAFDLGLLAWVQYVRIVDASNPADFDDPTADGFRLSGLTAYACTLTTPAPQILPTLTPTATPTATGTMDYLPEMTEEPTPDGLTVTATPDGLEETPTGIESTPTPDETIVPEVPPTLSAYPPFEPLTVCFVGHWGDDQFSEWEIINPNPSPLSVNPLIELQYDWAVYEDFNGGGDVLQEAEAWDYATPSTPYARSMWLGWYLVINGQPTELLGQTLVNADVPGGCGDVSSTIVTPDLSSMTNWQYEHFLSVYLDGDFGHLALDGDWGITEGIQGFAISMLNPEHAVLIPDIHRNTAIQMQLWIDTGQFYLDVRQTEIDKYTLMVDEDGAIALYRSGVLIQSTQISSLAGAWHLLRFEIIEDTLVVSINGIEILSYADPDPLPEGMIRYYADNSITGIRTDNLDIWRIVEPLGFSAMMSTSTQAMEAAEIFFGAIFSEEGDIVTGMKPPPGSHVWGFPWGDDQFFTAYQDSSGLVFNENWPISPVVDVGYYALGRWSNTGVFAYLCSDGGYNICHMKADGTDHQIIPLSSAISWKLDISPGGMYIAVEILPGGHFEPSDIVVFNIQTGEEHYVSNASLVGVEDNYLYYYQAGQDYERVYQMSLENDNLLCLMGLLGDIECAYNTSYGSPSGEGYLPYPIVADGKLWFWEYHIILSPHNNQFVTYLHLKNHLGETLIVSTDIMGLGQFDREYDWVGQPLWSPDGTRLIFPAGSLYVNQCIYLVDPMSGSMDHIEIMCGHVPNPQNYSWANIPEEFRGICPLDPTQCDTVTPPECPEFDGVRFSTSGNPPEVCELPPSEDCSSGVVQLISANTFQQQGFTQEATDMRAVGEQTGLYLHDGPTMNSQRIAVVPWGADISIDRYIEFPQTVTNDQLWYRVVEFSYENATYTFDGEQWDVTGIQDDEILDQLQAGIDVWINARMGNFDYIVGVNATTNPCEGIVSEIANTETITFVYNRIAAARYGIAHAYRNSIPNAEPNNPYPGTFRSTRRINPALLFNGLLIPYVNQIGYANFAYDSLNPEGAEGETASAIFNSEAIWMGGMPMTHNIDEGNNTSIMICGSRDPSHPSNNFTLAGWRHCDDEGGPSTGSSTRVWRNHQGIVVYYSRDPSIAVNNVIAQHGDHVGLFNFYVRRVDNEGAVTYPRRQIIRDVAGNIRVDGALALDQSENQQAFFDAFINPNPPATITLETVPTPFPPETINGLTQVRTGDYMFTERGNNTAYGHGYLIIGWGEIMSCPSALDKLWIFETPPSGANPDHYGQLFVDYDSRGVTYAVPYVVDFPGSIDIPGAQTQRPQPRPFYCVDYNYPSHQITRDGLAFYTFPDVVTIPFDRLYVSIDWSWEN